MLLNNEGSHKKAGRKDVVMYGRQQQILPTPTCFCAQNALAQHHLVLAGLPEDGGEDAGNTSADPLQ